MASKQLFFAGITEKQMKKEFESSMSSVSTCEGTLTEIMPMEWQVTFSGDDIKEIKEVSKCLKKKLCDFIFPGENTTFEEYLVTTLTKMQYTITTAESCTGGLLAGRIINAKGASSVYQQGYITYANKAKRKQLGVRKETLKKYGAVSKQTAKEMAKGAAMEADADVALSVTGIAGPDGGTKDKPVGLVYIGCCCKGKTIVEEHIFQGDRQRVRQSAVTCALRLLNQCLD